MMSARRWPRLLSWAYRAYTDDLPPRAHGRRSGTATEAHLVSEPVAARRYDALVFDLDGTLVDTAALHIAASHHAVRAVLGREVAAATVHASLGRPLPQSMAMVARGAGIADDALVAERVPALVTSFLAYYAAHQGAMVRLFPSVRTTLDELARRGYALAVLSNKLRDWGRAELASVGLAERIEVAVFAEDMPVPKPAGAALDPVLAALGLPAARTLLIGDGVADIACARAAGAGAVAALWGAIAPDDLRTMAPDHALAAIGDLLILCP